MAYQSQPEAGPQLVDLSAVLMNPEFQIRTQAEPHRSTVKRYANAYKADQPVPAITLARHKGTLVLVDGWHRVAALQSIGRTQVEAVVRPVASLEEAKWLGAEANLSHGRPLTSPEYRAAFKAYVRAGRHRKGRGFKSYRVIAAELNGVKAYTTIRQWMRKDFPNIAGKMGGNEEFKGKGGLDVRGQGPEDVLYWDAKAALETIEKTIELLSSEERRSELLVALKSVLERALGILVGAAHAVPDAESRGEVIVALEAALGDLKSKPYSLPPPPDF